MIGILLVTHGKLAEELRAAALTIQPGLERIIAVSLEWSETGEDAREKIRRGLAEADAGEGAVILTDMFGGTPTNLALPFLSKERVEIVTAEGEHMRLGELRVEGGDGSVGAVKPVPYEEITEVRLLDDRGREVADSTLHE